MKSDLSPNVGAIARPVIGSRLFKLALRWSDGEQLPKLKDREADIRRINRSRKQKINGSRSIKAAVEATTHAAEQIQRIRRVRAGRRNYSPTQTIEQRVEARRHDIAYKMVNPIYRFEQKPEIRTDPGTFGDVSQSETLDWNYYPKSVRYPKKVVETTITLPSMWYTAVFRERIAELSGLVTLGASPVEGAPRGVRLYAARWIHQGRGYHLSVRDGYIACDETFAYHSTTSPRAALKGLERKRSRPDQHTTLTAAEDRADAFVRRWGFDVLAQRFPKLRVRVHHARETGACEPGIRNWCERTGLDYDKGIAPLPQVIAAYREVPLPEARRAIIRATAKTLKARNFPGEFRNAA